MNRYELREQVGQGNYGTCHLALHLKERKQYVIKRIPVFAMEERGEALREARPSIHTTTNTRLNSSVLPFSTNEQHVFPSVKP